VSIVFDGALDVSATFVDDLDAAEIRSHRMSVCTQHRFDRGGAPSTARLALKFRGAVDDQVDVYAGTV